MRLTVSLLGALFLFLCAYTGYSIWTNNRAVDYPDEDAIQSAFTRGVSWADANRTKILNSRNPMLWHMIQKAGQISSNRTLINLYSEYSKRNFDRGINNPWRPLFYPGTWTPIRYQQISKYPDYNQFFFYAFTCDSDLAQVPAIAIQNDPDFCSRRLLSPACATHQLMGMLLLKRSNCGDQKLLARNIAALQSRISRELHRDPRIIDIYMQRVLMLAESGAIDLVKPAWIHNLS